MPEHCTDRAPTGRSSNRTAKKRLGIVFASLLAVALCVTIRYYWGAQPVHAGSTDHAVTSSGQETAVSVRDPRESSRAASPSSEANGRVPSTAAASDSAVPPIVATVNTQRITREDLARECRRRHGKEVLEAMVNKHLIVEECRGRGISVTRAEVDAEIERLAKPFMPVEQWLKLLKQERNITPAQYADGIWTMLALRKLAGERLTISREELVREFETQYGDAVRARLIAVSSPEKARNVQAQAAAKPDDFGNLAKEVSEDAPSASAKGVIQPIRRHGSYKEIEDAVFNMPDGAVSPVIHAGGQYVILKREGLLPARNVKFEQIGPQLEEILRDRKMRVVAQDVFRQLQANVKVENVWNDPVRQQQMPGVAATVNGVPVTIRELDDECLTRYGRDTLEAMVSRKILELACQRRSITVTEQDIDQEVARAALAGVKPRPDGSPDVQAWLDLITKKQGIPLDLYRNDVLWCSVVLKKLVGNKVDVSEDDLRKGYEANYGPRVRCLAIVVNNQRRAQQVFELARKNNTAEYFGELAAQYSIEPGSQSLHGEVPPIKKYGGQPKLEEEAFALRPGELSGIIQVADKFILLRCEGYTKPSASVEFAKVRNEIYEDLQEKKLRLAMAACYEDLHEGATIDNYLAGTTHSPKRGGAAPAAKVPTLRQVPGG
jgi:parvulin-like peptidyl-prolyl isomerase